MRIFCSGGAGYIGSTLVPMLLRERHHVTVLDHFSHGANSLAECVRSPHFVAVNGDARDIDIVRPLVAKADVVIPLAAIVGAPACKRDKSAATSTNYIAVVNLMEMLSRDQRVIIPVTNSGYGIGGESECTEDSPIAPLTLYGRTKMEAERIVLDRDNAISFRLATVFGSSPRMRTDLLVNDFVYRAMADKALVVFEGHFRRNFIAVLDVARAFCHGIAKFDEMKGRAYNVGRSDCNLTKLELCERIQKHIPDFVYLESQIGTDPDKRDYVVSNARMEATGWRALETLDDGIRELMALVPMLKKTVYGNV